MIAAPHPVTFILRLQLNVQILMNPYVFFLSSYLQLGGSVLYGLATLSKEHWIPSEKHDSSHDFLKMVDLCNETAHLPFIHHLGKYRESHMAQGDISYN